MYSPSPLLQVPVSTFQSLRMNSDYISLTYSLIKGAIIFGSKLIFIQNLCYKCTNSFYLISLGPKILDSWLSGKSKVGIKVGRNHLKNIYALWNTFTFEAVALQPIYIIINSVNWLYRWIFASFHAGFFSILYSNCVPDYLQVLIKGK